MCRSTKRASSRSSGGGEMKYVALIGGAVLFGNLASAHDFYDEKCCHEQDCRLVKCNEIVSFGASKGWSWRKVFSQPTGCILARMAIATFVLASLVWSQPGSAFICRRAYSARDLRSRRASDWLLDRRAWFARIVSSSDSR